MYAFCWAASIRTHAEIVMPCAGTSFSGPLAGIEMLCVPENFAPAPISDAALTSAVNDDGSALYAVASCGEAGRRRRSDRRASDSCRTSRRSPRRPPTSLLP